MSSLRLPSLTKRLRIETGEAVLQYELMEEQAHSLGRSGKKVEAALAALKAHDEAHAGAAGGADRAPLLKAAADAVWSFLVQREAMGLRDRTAVIAQYGIPREVLNRMGAR